MAEKYEDMIREANKEIDRNKDIVSRDADRCRLHFMAPTGWMNDPNGLTVYKDEYHLFYQYNPYSAFWGRMYWGHAKSRDLINWKHLPVALAPSEFYESGGGCFSGSAVVHEGTLNLFYSASTFDRERKLHAQTQCRAFGSDGIRFVKDEKNPLIAAPPEGYSLSFRDPKVWKHQNEWYMVLGGMKDEKGQVFLYKSSDMRGWRFCSVLAKSDGKMGFMWECPDFFPLGGKHVLIISALTKGVHRPANQTMYIVGEFDYHTYDFTWERTGRFDYGDEFYAPQSFLDKEGRRTVFGWLNTWNFGFGAKDVPPKTADKKWCGSFSFPRVLSLTPDDTLMVNPHPAVLGLTKENIVSLKDVGAKTLSGEMLANNISCYVIEAMFDIVDNNSKFGILFGPGGKGSAAATLTFDAYKKTVTLERQFSQYYREHAAEGFVDYGNGKLEMKIYVDGPVAEVYLQNGRSCITGHADPELMRGGFSIFSERGDINIESLDVYRLKNRGK